MNIASYFRLWRGDIVFRFTFAKTKFHGGRYMVSFNPRTTLTTVTTNANTTVEGPEIASSLVQPYGYSQIMDMRDNNVFEFNVPYVSENPYTNFMSAIGSISVVCMDPLQANASVTPSVPFMVEVAGGENFELADYAGNMFVSSYGAVVYQQSGEVTNSGLSSAVKATTASAAQHTIGEQFTSVKQLIMIPSYVAGTVAGNATTQTYIPPWHHYPGGAQVSQFPLTSPINVLTSFVGCGYSPGALASMYAYARGSTDFHAYAVGGTTSKLILVADQLPLESSYGNTTRTDYQGRSNTSSTPKVVAYAEAPLHVRCPAYQSVCRVPTRANRALTVTRALNQSSFSAVNTAYGNNFRMTAQNIGASGVVVQTSTSAGDDATLTSYIGPEPVIIPNAASTNVLFPDWYASTV